MTFRALLITTALSAVSTTALLAGPPWISVELPANPHHASTRDAALLIRAYHHSAAIDAPVTGIAEGIVDGKRVRIPLDVRATNIPGVFAVRNSLPKHGAWVMAITLTESKTASATALVSVDSRGRIVAVNVPSDRSRDGWVVPRAVSRSDIEAALQAAQIASNDAPANSLNFAYAGVFVLLLSGLIARRRKS